MRQPLTFFKMGDSRDSVESLQLRLPRLIRGVGDLTALRLYTRLNAVTQLQEECQECTLKSERALYLRGIIPGSTSCCATCYFCQFGQILKCL